MTRADLEAMFSIIDDSDWDRLGRFFHPDLRYQRPGFPLLEGRDANLNFYRNVRSIRGAHTFYNFAVTPDTGACWGRFVGHKTDGTPVDLQFADCYEFKDGLIWHRKSHFYTPLA
jgi:ketosteroid isomerase-like protein